MEKRSAEDHSTGAKEMTEKINKGGRPPIILTDEQVAQTEALRIVCTKK